MGCYPHLISLICVCDSVVSFSGLAASVLVACALVCINWLSLSCHFGLSSSSQNRSEENQDNTDGIAALQAAGEVHNRMNALGGRATVEAPTVSNTSDITEQLRRMSETFSAHLTAITDKVDSLTERVDYVERGRSPSTPPQAPAPGGSEKQTPMTSTTPWCQRGANE